MDTGLLSMVGQATLGAKLLLLLLLLMSVVSWGLIFQKWRSLKAAKQKAEWLAEQRKSKADIKAEAKAKAAAEKARAEEEKAEKAKELKKAVDSGELPEWMQPVQF